MRAQNGRLLTTAWLLAATFVGTATAGTDESPLATHNVVLITADGLRWQEVFRGADESLISTKPGGVADVDGTRKKYSRPTIEERRTALMPFFWSVVAREGQIYGNRDKDSPARVLNRRNFSYPGYNELLTGAPDDRINSNDKKLNPNVSVLEWAAKKPGFEGKVAAFGSWDVFPYILNQNRGKIVVNAGWEPIAGDDLSPAQKSLNDEMARRKRRWADCRDDDVTFPVAFEHLIRHSPRFLYISEGDTDEHGHGGRYDLLLDAAHQFDADLRRLWETFQSRPEYRGKTTLIVTTDHGRGDAPLGWKNHGAAVAGSEAIWIGVLGPDTPALGERSGTSEVTQGQVAATAAALLGLDYRAEVPGAAPPIVDAIGQKKP